MNNFLYYHKFDYNNLLDFNNIIQLMYFAVNLMNFTDLNFFLF